MMDQDTLQAIRQMMAEQLEPIKQDLSGVKQDLSGVKQDLSGVKQDLADVKQRTTKIEFTLEHDVSKQLQLLSEGQKGINEKFAQLDRVAEDVEEIKEKVFALEEASRNQASQIRELKIAK